MSEEIKELTDKEAMKILGEFATRALSFREKTIFFNERKKRQ